MGRSLIRRVALGVRHVRYAVLRFRHPAIDRFTLRSLTYVRRQGRRLNTADLPQTYVENWFIGDTFPIYTDHLLFSETRGRLAACTPYVVFCYLFSRYSCCRFRLLSQPQGFRFGFALRYTSELDFAHLEEMQHILYVVYCARDAGVGLPKESLCRVDDYYSIAERLYCSYEQITGAAAKPFL